MMIRTLLPTDDLRQAAEVLFLADCYIFSDLFGTQEQAGQLGPHFFQRNDSALFPFPKTLIAEENQKILGILCYRDGICRWDATALQQQYALQQLQQPVHFDRVNHSYFDKIATAPLPSNSAECTFLAVHPDCRKRGIGRALLQQFLSLPEYQTFYLDVLVSNTAALRLYQRMGFHICSEHPAYPPASSDKCLRMEAIPSR